MDVAATVKRINEFLGLRGYKPRDADGNDFQAEEGGVRFKTGTVLGEVTITVWRGVKQVDTIRVLKDDEESVSYAMRRIDTVIQQERGR